MYDDGIEEEKQTPKPAPAPGNADNDDDKEDDAVDDEAEKSTSATTKVTTTATAKPAANKPDAASDDVEYYDDDEEENNSNNNNGGNGNPQRPVNPNGISEIRGKKQQDMLSSIVSSRCSLLIDQLVLYTSSKTDVRRRFTPFAYSNDRISEALHDSNQCCFACCLFVLSE